MSIITNKEELFLEWINNISDHLVFLDVGANKGFYSEIVIKKLYDKLETLYCFEPVESNYLQCVSKFRDDPKIKLYMNACSNETKDSTFYQIIHHDEVYEGLSSLNYRPVFANLTSQEINVKCVMIDNIVNLNSTTDIFAKIDVEGFELEVLEGMFQLFLNQKVKAIQFEYGNAMLEKNKNLKDIILFLEKFNNYSVYDFNSNSHFIKIDNSNINNYINLEYTNLYILKNENQF